MKKVMLSHDASTMTETYGIRDFESLVVVLPDDFDSAKLKELIYHEMINIECNIKDLMEERSKIFKEMDETGRKVVVNSPIDGTPMKSHKGGYIMDHTDDHYAKFEPRIRIISSRIDKTISFKELVKKVIDGIDGAEIEVMEPVVLDRSELLDIEDIENR